jgi:hypothetical protein
MRAYQDRGVSVNPQRFGGAIRLVGVIPSGLVTNPPDVAILEVVDGA